MVSTTIKKYYQNDIPYLILENNEIIVTISPAMGGKILGLQKIQSGTQFLLQPNHDYNTNRLPYYGADYNRYQPAGFDDCFPTMRASSHPGKGRDGQPANIHFPDHGELWSIPWDYYVSDESVYLSVKGVRLDYEFSKVIRLEQSSVYVDYRLINYSTVPFSYIWAAHPLLEVQPGAEICFEQRLNKVLLDYSTDPALGRPGTRISWPGLTHGKNTNYSIIPPPKEHAKNYIVKFYTDPLIVGTCSYVRADTGERIIFKFDPEKIPYIGIFHQYLEKSTSLEQAHHKIALQPSIGRPGSLRQACARNECGEIDAFGMQEWSLQLSVA